MIDFMIIGLPRSGTTWAANWLTTNDTFCLHDPLYKMHYSEWDTNRTWIPHPMLYNQVGVSCTGIWRWPEWVNAHPARKIVVTRALDAVQDSLTTIGLPRIEDNAEEMLEQIDAPRVPFEHLFDPKRAPGIWKHLVGEYGFCPLRHSALCEYMMEPNFNALHHDKKVTESLYNELLMR